MAGELRFDGKVVVITGAGSGLGRTYALAFGERGAKVVVNDLGGDMKGEGKSSAAADKVVAEIRSNGGEAVANYNSVEDGDKVIQTALDNYGKVDILINNAGILRDRSFLRISDLDWDLIHRVHLRGAFLVTRAAWQHMKKNKFGRIIMTSSASGLYGNFGQANYSAAKMGLVGLSNTLAVEGRKYNITCNAIAPVAASRMTKNIMPENILAALQPEFVAAPVLWLCHESCTETGGIFEIGGGHVAKVQLMKSNGAVVRTKEQGVTPEMVRNNWDKICDFREYTTPANINESSAIAYDAFLSVEEGRQPVKPNLTSATTPDAAIGYSMSDQTYSYTTRDVILYALGVGCSTVDKDFLQFLYENSENFSTLPTFGSIITMSGVFKLFGGSDFPVKIDPTQLLHGEEYLEVIKPLSGHSSLRSESRVADVMDKGRGAVFVVECNVYNENGEKVLYGQNGVYVQNMGGYGGKRKSSIAKETQSPPKRKPDATIREKTGVDQAALYRLSGDPNPLHIDPSFAAMGGFDKPILHGLCTYGYAGKHVLRQYCNNDTSKFKAIKVRFSKPVIPGQTLQTDMWKEGSRVFFQTMVVENGNVCLTGGYVDIVDDIRVGAGVGGQQNDEAQLQTDYIFQELSDRLKERPHLVKRVNAILGFKITKGGKTVREWTVDLKNAPGMVFQGLPKNKNKPNVTITVSDQDFMDLASGQINAQQAFFSGKLKVVGNIMLGPKLETIFRDELSKL